jgi:Na+/H+ antiporter NhaD/arsenite permease-like protein
MDRYIALAVFIASYGFFVLFPKHRSWVAVAGALALMLSGVVSPMLVFFGEGGKESLISWNVMGIFVGTLILADLFIWSRVPHYVAERLVNRSRSVCWAMVKVCAFSGFLSIFAENVAVVLIVAPIAFALAEKLKTSPVPLIVGVTVSSNLQGTATLIGDPASMIFAEYADASFNDFFWYKGQGLGVFFAIQFGFLTSLPVLYWAFRHLNQKVELVAEERVISWGPTIFLATMMLALAMASSLQAHDLLGAICMIWGLGGLIWYELLGRNDRERFPDTPWVILKRLDWDSALFLMGVFTIVGTLVETGWIKDFADWLKSILGGNLPCLVQCDYSLFDARLGVCGQYSVSDGDDPGSDAVGGAGGGARSLALWAVDRRELRGEHHAHRSVGQYRWRGAAPPARAYFRLSRVREDRAAVHTRRDHPSGDLSLSALGDLLASVPSPQAERVRVR